MNPHFSARGLALLATALVGLLLSPSVHAQSQVFHSPDDNGEAGCGGGTPCPFADKVYVWATTPPISCGEAEECQVFCGDVCAIDTLIEIEGGSFGSIAPAPGIFFTPACTDPGSPCSLPANTVSVHLVGSFAGEEEFQSGPRKLAELALAPGAALNSTAISANGVKLVNAEFAPQSLGTLIIAAPEPGVLTSLAAGVVLMHGLRRRRSNAAR